MGIKKGEMERRKGYGKEQGESKRVKDSKDKQQLT